MAVSSVIRGLPKKNSWEMVQEIAADDSESILELLDECGTLKELKLTSSPTVDDQLFQKILQKIQKYEELKRLSLCETHIVTATLRGLSFSSLKIRGCASLAAIEITECHNLTKLTLNELKALVTLNIFKCFFLEVIDLRDAKLPSLENLSVRYCSSLKSVNASGLASLKMISVCDNNPDVCLNIENVFKGRDTTPKPSPQPSPKE